MCVETGCSTHFFQFHHNARQSQHAPASAATGGNQRHRVSAVGEDTHVSKGRTRDTHKSTSRLQRVHVERGRHGDSSQPRVRRRFRSTTFTHGRRTDKHDRSTSTHPCTLSQHTPRSTTTDLPPVDHHTSIRLSSTPGGTGDHRFAISKRQGPTPSATCSQNATPTARTATMLARRDSRR